MSILNSLEKIRNDFVADMDKVIADFSKLRSVKVEKKIKSTKTRTRSIKGVKKEGINKSNAIREYISEFPNCQNKDVVSGLREKFKIEVNPAHVSIVRKNMEKGKTKKVKSVKVKTKQDLTGVPMTSLCAKILRNHKQGLKLKQIAEIVKNSGYHYEGSKGFDGLRQNVYQALNNLAKTGKHRGYEGQDPVVLKDKEKHLYLLNPKAKTA